MEKQALPKGLCGQMCLWREGHLTGRVGDKDTRMTKVRWTQFDSNLQYLPGSETSKKLFHFSGLTFPLCKMGI